MTKLTRSDRSKVARAIAATLIAKGTWTDSSASGFCKDVSDGTVTTPELIEMHVEATIS